MTCLIPGEGLALLSRLETKLHYLETRLTNRVVTAAQTRTKVVELLRDYRPGWGPIWMLCETQRICACLLRSWTCNFPRLRSSQALVHARFALRFVLETAVLEWLKLEVETHAANPDERVFHTAVAKQMTKIAKLCEFARRHRVANGKDTGNLPFLLSTINWDWMVDIWQSKVCTPDQCPSYTQAPPVCTELRVGCAVGF